MNDYDNPDLWPEPQDLMKGYVPSEEDDRLAKEACNMLSTAAEEAVREETYGLRCIAGEAVFFYNYPYGLMPGHIYSHLGIKEFKISQSCEFHFDQWTLPDDEEGEA